jgi:hypothetical protein
LIYPTGIDKKNLKKEGTVVPEGLIAWLAYSDISVK